MRIHQAPEVDVTIIQNGHYPAGCGEPVVTCVGPAIANAVSYSCFKSSNLAFIH